MRRPILWLTAAALLCGFAAPPTPKQAVARLDVNDAKYTAPACVKARAAALDNKKHPILGAVVGIGGNIVAPFAGTAASTGLNYRFKSRRDKLAKNVAGACVPDPLGADASDVVVIPAPPATPVVAVN